MLCIMFMIAVTTVVWYYMDNWALDLAFTYSLQQSTFPGIFGNS